MFTSDNWRSLYVQLHRLVFYALLNKPMSEVSKMILITSLYRMTT